MLKGIIKARWVKLEIITDVESSSDVDEGLL